MNIRIIPLLAALLLSLASFGQGYLQDLITYPDSRLLTINLSDVRVVTHDPVTRRAVFQYATGSTSYQTPYWLPEVVSNSQGVLKPIIVYVTVNGIRTTDTLAFNGLFVTRIDKNADGTAAITLKNVTTKYNTVGNYAGTVSAFAFSTGGGGGGGDNWGTQVVQHGDELSGNGTSGSPLTLAQQGATNGQALKWNTSVWLPGNVVSAVSGGTTGLTFSDISGTQTLGGGPLALGSGGTNATTAADARTNLLAAKNGGNTDLRWILLGNDGLRLKDPDSSHYLTVTTASNLTANRTLTINPGNADRTLTIAGTASVNGTNTGDQYTSVADQTFIANNSGGSGAATAVTAANATAMLSTVTSGAKGLAPASGGGTANFLRADGTWAAPPGSGSPTSAVAFDVTVGASNSTTTQTAVVFSAAAPTFTAGKSYYVDVTLLWQNSATTYAFVPSYAGTATGNFYVTYVVTNSLTAGNANTCRSGKNLAPMYTSNFQNPSSVSNVTPARICGTFICTGTGTFFPTYAPSASGTSTIQAGSFMTIKEN